MAKGTYLAGLKSVFGIVNHQIWDQIDLHRMCAAGE